MHHARHAAYRIEQKNRRAIRMECGERQIFLICDDPVKLRARGAKAHARIPLSRNENVAAMHLRKEYQPLRRKPDRPPGDRIIFAHCCRIIAAPDPQIHMIERRRRHAAKARGKAVMHKPGFCK